MHICPIEIMAVLAGLPALSWAAHRVLALVQRITKGLTTRSQREIL